MTEDGDRELLEQVAAGSQPALETLYRRHETRLYRYLLGVLGRNETRASEVTCETFFEVWKQAGTFRGDSAVTTWIFSIARHRALSLLRRPERGGNEEALEQVVADDPDPLQTLASGESAALVRRALETLSPEHREVIELACYNDFSYPDIAKIVGCPVNTVKTRAYYARQQLKRELVKLGHE